MKEHQVIKAKRCSAWSEGAFDREKELLLNIGRHCCLWHLQSPLACSPRLPIYNGDSFHNGHSPARRRDCKLEIGKYLNWWRDDSSRRCRVIILGWIVVVSRPTRWSLWYWYLDVYVDHLYISKSKWQRDIVQRCASQAGTLSALDAKESLFVV